MSDAASRSEIEAWLIARMGPEGAPDETFHGAGLDSLSTTALMRELASWLDRPVPPTLAWHHPTPARLAGHLVGQGDAADAPRPLGRVADEPIAIVGLACRLPGAPTPRAFWQALCAGRDCTGPVPSDRWAAWQAASPSGVEPVYRGGFLDAVDGFDPAFFGISPREAHQIDPQQRLMLELTWEAFEDAGLDPGAWRAAPVGVFTGLVWRDYADLQSAVAAEHGSHTCVGHAGSIAANRVSYAFGFEGPSMVIDTACSSALVAVHTACESLRRGESRLAVAGGVQLNLSPRTASAVNAFGALAPDGRCKTFSADADGYGRGEGAGVVLLEPLSAARRAGRTIYAIIRGSAVNNDGASNGITAPNPEAQRRLLRDAYARAGVAPTAAQYVELHGTGTPLGDPMEAGALGAVLGAGRPADHPLRIGSVKSNIGHLEAAAGIAGLIKLALCVHHRWLPASLHAARLNPRIDFDGWRLALQREAAPWPTGDGPPLGGVSSFGFGGTNCHVVLGGLPTPAPPEAVEPPAACAAPPVVFVFAGAGTPAPDLAPLLQHEPAFRLSFERCDRIYRRLAGWSLLDAASTPDGAAWRPGRTQLPLNLAFGVSMAARWRARGIEPAAVVGYSVGEWAAAHVAGAITLEEAFRVCLAYTEVQRVVEDGRATMGVVGLPADALRAHLGAHPEVSISAENGPRSSGIGGAPAAVDALVRALSADGVFARRVQIDFFAHIPAARPLGEALARRLADLRGRPTTVPFHSTVRGAGVDGVALDGAYWAANLREPVRFAEAIAGLRASGPRLWLDVNSHPIHGPSIAENLPPDEAPGHLLESAVNGEAAVAVLARTMARLRAAGVRPQPPAAPVPVLISAHGEAALRARATDLADAAATQEVADLAAALAGRVAHHRHRLALGAESSSALSAALAAFGRGEPVGATGEAAARPLVFAFTGQGTQWAGMARDLLDEHPVFRAAFYDFSAAVERAGGPPLAPLIDDPQVDTAVVQPLVVGVQLGLVAALRDLGVEPAVVLGHSLGELTAAHVAGALGVDALARLVVHRGRLMAGPEGAGAMAAVDADRALIDEAIGDDDVVIAACNSARGHTLAGDPDALEAVVSRLKARGAGVIRLAGDRAFHSPRMAQAAAALRDAVHDLAHASPRRPIVSTTTGALHADFGPAHWAENVRAPVRFDAALAAALAQVGGEPLVIELGPHPALLRHIGGDALPTLRRGRSGRQALVDLIGRLYVAGRDFDADRLFPAGAPALPLPANPWQRSRYWFAHDAVAAHPLLGDRTRRVDDGWRFEARLTPAQPAWLSDHRYGGTIVVAAAAQLIAALDAQRRIEPDAVPWVENLTVQRGLTLAPGETRRLVLDRGADGRFELSTVDAAGARGVHADGVTRGGAAEPVEPLDVAAVRARCAEAFDGPGFTAAVEAAGVELGPAFCWAEAAWRGDGELLVRLRAPTATDERALGIAPGLLDTGFQGVTLISGLTLAAGEGLMMLGVQRLGVWGALDGPTWCHVRRRSVAVDDGLVIADVTLYADDGRAVGRIDGVAVKRSSMATLLGRPTARVFGWRWTPTPVEAARALDGAWLVRGGADDDAQALSDALAARGAAVTRVEGGAPLPTGRWRGVVDLGATGAPRAVIGDTFALARAVMATPAPTWLISRDAVAVGAEAIDPGQAARWAVAHTAAREAPEPGWRVLDVPAGDADWGAVADALTAAPPVLAWRDGRWLRPSLTQESPQDTPEIRGRWVITGGLGALGRALATRLVERGASAVVLMGRSALEASGLAFLEGLGPQVHFHKGDVSHPADVAVALGVADDVPLRGVVHAAGVLADATLTNQSESSIDATLAPKLDGAEALADAIGDTPLDAFVLFGSVAGALGSPGQAPYAAANAALSAVVRRRRAAGRPAILLDWGPWDAVGMAARVDAGGRAQRALALDALAPATALDAFERALGSDAERLLILAPTGPLTAFDRLGAAPTEPRAPAVPQTDDLRGAIIATVRQVLGLGPDDALPPDRPLRDLGLDSLMALDARRHLATLVGRSLPATLLFDHPTVDALVALLAPTPSALPRTRRRRTTDAGDPIALVGLACRLPGGVDDPDALWQLLLDGRDATTEVPPDRWDIDAWYDPDPAAPGKMHTRRGGFIDRVDRFDAGFFGMAAPEARSVDPQQRMLLELTWEALERAGLPPSSLSGKRVGVFLGMAVSEYGQLELHAPDPRGITPWSGQGAVLSMAAGRIAYTFGFEGPALVVDTACSSSLVAAHLATRSLRRGECDLAIIAGTNLMLTPRMTVFFTKMRALSPDGRCKTFAAEADGYGRAEGLGVIVAQRLEDARAEGQRVLACIHGTATNQDGRSVGLTAPRGPAQVGVIRDALDDAGLTPSAIGYVEAHGTGTPLGDSIELGALAEVFGEREGKLALGSFKSNVGHLESAAGIGGLLKLTLMLARGGLPPTLHVDHPTARIDWQSAPLRLVRAAEPWAGPARFGGVSSFGFSGSNAHCVLGAAEPDPDAPETLAPGPLILPLSARHPAALTALAEQVAARLTAGADLRAVARAAAHRRDHHPHRLAVVAADAAEAAAQLTRALDDPQSPLRGHAVPGATPPPLPETEGLGPRARLEALARAWTTGAATDWAGLIPVTGPWADLPTYPWQRARYWAAHAASLAPVHRDAAPGEGTSTPLYGRHLRSPLPGWQFEARHRPDASSDHRPFGRPVVAGAQHILSTLHAAAAVGLSGSLGGVEFVRPLVVRAGAPVVGHTTITPADADHAVSIASQGEGDDRWQTHMRARWRSEGAPPPLPDALPVLEAACRERLPARRYVEDPALGPTYQCLVELRRGPTHVVGRLACADDGRLDEPLHPGMLDSAFRALKALPGAGFAPDAPLIPIGVRRVTLTPAGRTHRGAVRLVGRQVPGTGGDPRILESDLWLLDEVGEPLAVFEGLTARAVDGDEMFVAGIDPSGLCLDRRWVDLPAAPPPPTRQVGLLVPPDARAEAFAVRLEATLRAAGHGVERCSTDRVPPSLDALVDLHLLAEDGRAHIASALMTAAALDPLPSPPQLIWLTRGAVDGGAARVTIDPAGAALWGAVATVAAEAGPLRPRVFDLSPGDLDPADAVAAMLGDHGDESRLALRAGRLRALRLAPIPRRELAARPASVRGTWVITGGLGAVGMALAEHLVERGVDGLILIGRRPPDDAVRGRLAQWRAAGTAIRTLAVDVTDAAALDAGLADARPGLPPIIAAVHAAGVAGDAALRALDVAAIERVLAPKIDGVAALERATADDPLEVFVLLGSVAGVLGNPGQAAYGAANGYLDGWAARRRAAGRPVIALDFGPWAGGMADAATRARLARAGAAAFPASEGASLVSRLADVDRAALVVARIDWGRWAALDPRARATLAPLLETRAATPAAASGDAPDRVTLATLDRDARIGALHRWLAQRVGAMLELPQPAALHTPLIDLGFDSFFAVRLRDVLDGLDLRVPIAWLMGDATVDRLAHALADVVDDPPEAGEDQADEDDADDLEEFLF